MRLPIRVIIRVVSTAPSGVDVYLELSLRRLSYHDMLVLGLVVSLGRLLFHGAVIRDNDDLFLQRRRRWHQRARRRQNWLPFHTAGVVRHPVFTHRHITRMAETS